jgi:hypothetical protein
MISDITELEMCNSLRKLNLKDNNIDDPDNLFYLATLPLVYLNLVGNPIYKRENYKEIIQYNLPNLKALDIDNFEDDEVERMNSTTSSVNRSLSIRPETPSNSIKIDNSIEFDRNYLKSSGETLGGRPTSNGRRINKSIDSENSSPAFKKTRIIEQEFDINKSLNLSKDLKPVIVKKEKTIDSKMLLYQVKDQQDEIAEEVMSNIDKLHSSKQRVQKHYEEISDTARTLRGTRSNKVMMLD